jgi:hypothetical protein
VCLLPLSSPSWPEIDLLKAESTDVVRDHYLISASLASTCLQGLCCTCICLHTRAVRAKCCTFTCAFVLPLEGVSVYKSLCCIGTCAFVLHMVGVCLQEPVLHLYVRVYAAPEGCLSKRACVAFVRARLCCTWRVSVYKSLCCICTCAFVLHPKGVCLKEPVRHLYMCVFDVPRGCLSKRAYTAQCTCTACMCLLDESVDNIFCVVPGRKEERLIEKEGR